MTYAIQLITSFTGSMGFALLFHINHNKLLKAGLGGVIAWGSYLAAGIWSQSDPVKCLIATLILTFYAEYMARHEKTPVTIFLVSGAIPLFPGGALYQTMSYAVENQWQAFLSHGFYTLLLSLAIAVGILFGMFISRILIRRPRK